MDLQSIKQRFGIVGNDPALNRALDIALQVAPSDISVLVIGESGVGKEHIPQVIHQLSYRKHGPYIAVNCGAIPEGTIDSELFGHEKGSFTGANETRKGYFEVADKGTIFLDEIAELPLSTQVRLLRILEYKEFMKVGSSKIQKTDVRVVAATNVNLENAVKEGKFRQDLYYRLNTVQIDIPPLRKRGDDIVLLFRKFAQTFAEKYDMPSPIRLDKDAQQVLSAYHWPGNIRQLRNITEQMSIIEQENRTIDGIKMAGYLPNFQADSHPVIIQHTDDASFSSERMMYRIMMELEELKKDVAFIKQMVAGGAKITPHMDNATMIYHDNTFDEYTTPAISHPILPPVQKPQEIRHPEINHNVIDTEEVVDDNLSLADSEVILIKRALEKHKGKRKAAAKELKISERTLYRKIKEYNIKNETAQ